MNIGRERVLTGLTLVGLTVAFLAAVHLPGRHSDAALKAEIKQSEDEIARGPRVLEEFRNARQELDRRRVYLRESAEAVAEPHDLLETISRLAKESGLAVIRLEPEAVRPQASYTEHPFRLEFRGTLAAATDFLRGLEGSPRIHAINELTIRKPTNGASGADLEGTLRFTVFAGRVDPGGLAEENGSIDTR